MSEKMKTGDLIFVRGRSPLSRIIEYFDGKFSHCAIALSDNVILESQYLTNTVIRPMHYSDDQIEIVNIGLSDKQRDQLCRLAINVTGKQYGYKEILWILFSHLFGWKGKDRWNSPKKFICSEVLVYLLLHIGWLENNPTKINYLLDATPNQLCKIINNQMIDNKAVN